MRLPSAATPGIPQNAELGRGHISWEMRSYRWAQEQAGVVFFDRGVPDVVGYLRLTGLRVPAHVFAAAECFRYHRQVLIAPPWSEIFSQDSERTQDLAEAERTYDAMVEIYTELGYEVIDLPRVDVATRIEFVTARIISGEADDPTAGR